MVTFRIKYLAGEGICAFLLTELVKAAQVGVVKPLDTHHEKHDGVGRDVDWYPSSPERKERLFFLQNTPTGTLEPKIPVLESKTGFPEILTQCRNTK